MADDTNGRANGVAWCQMRSSGAYARSRRRSEPSARKRTTTWPPSVERRARRPRRAASWRTLSPTARVGTSSRGAMPASVVAAAVDGDLPPDDGTASRAAADAAAQRRRRADRRAVALRSCSTRLCGISSRNCDGRLLPRCAEERALAGVDHRQLLAGARDRDVAEAALLLEVRLLDRADVREEVLLHADHEDRVELEALRVVQRHQRDVAARSSVDQRVGVGDQRDLLQEAGERRLLGARVVLARDADELLQVLDAARGLDRAARPRAARSRPMRPERSSTPRAASPTPRARRRDRAARRIKPRKPRTAALGGRREAGALGIGDAHPTASRRAKPARARPGGRRSSSPMPRRGWLMMRRSEISSAGLSSTLQVRHRVLDLGALVEARRRRSPGTARRGARAGPRARATARSCGRRRRSRARASRSSSSAPMRAATRRASSCSSSTSITRTGSPLAEVAPEPLLEAARVVLDDGVGRVEDALRRAVVLLEPDRPRASGKSRSKSRMLRMSAPRQRVDRTGRRRRRRTRCGARRRAASTMRYCAWFVSWYSSTSRCVERALPALAHVVEALEQVDRAHEHVVEVHRVRLRAAGARRARRRRPRSGRRSCRPARGTRARRRAGSSRRRCASGCRAAGSASGRGRAPRGTTLTSAHLVGLVVDREVRAVARGDRPRAAGCDRRRRGTSAPTCRATARRAARRARASRARRGS